MTLFLVIYTEISNIS